MRIFDNIKNRKIILISLIPVSILIIFYVIKFLLNLEAEFLELLIPIFSILSTFFIPFITNEIERNKESQKIKRIYQKSFNYLGNLCILCIERKGQLLANDIKIFQLAVKLKNYQNELLRINISYNIEGKSETILIRDRLSIWLNIDIAEGRVWGAGIRLLKDDKLLQNKKDIKSEVFSILDNIRKKQGLNWDEEKLKYFMTNFKDT